MTIRRKLKNAPMALVMYVTVVLGSCDGDDKKSDDPTTTDSPESRDFSDYSGRGSEACQEWQYSLCEYLFDTCRVGAGTRERCEAQYGSMVCISDEIASACADTLQDADCASPPSECDHHAVADPQPAIDGCNALIDAECARWVRCDLADTAALCREELEVIYSCDDAIGLMPWYEECLEKTRDRGCADLPPDGCEGLILAI